MYVEAQPMYEHLQDEEGQALEERTSLSFWPLQPAPSVMELQPDARSEHPARLAARQAMPPPLEGLMRKFKQVVYTVMDVRWGMALNLSN